MTYIKWHSMYNYLIINKYDHVKKSMNLNMFHQVYYLSLKQEFREYYTVWSKMTNNLLRRIDSPVSIIRSLSRNYLQLSFHFQESLHFLYILYLKDFDLVSRKQFSK